MCNNPPEHSISLDEGIRAARMAQAHRTGTKDRTLVAPTGCSSHVRLATTPSTYDTMMILFIVRSCFATNISTSH